MMAEDGAAGVQSRRANLVIQNLEHGQQLLGDGYLDTLAMETTLDSRL